MAGIYIHIPFCKQACHYCNFHFSTNTSRVDEMVDTIVKEIGLRKEFFVQETKINTIYLGGGTPSLLSADQLSKIFNELTNTFTIDDNPEITLEANPDDLTKEKLLSLKTAGVNRLSIGVQSFLDEELKMMNRVHDSKEAIQCVKDAQEIGINNISIDLIFGVQNSSLQSWESNLQKAITLDVPHMSCYNLTVEPKTALHHFVKTGKVEPVDDELSARQFGLTMDLLESYSFDHYEISNYAKSGFISNHNTNYWRSIPYLGLGPSAHSYDGKNRQWNLANNALYLQSLKSNVLPLTKETLTPADRFNEYLMTRLRTKWGCNWDEVIVLLKGDSKTLYNGVQVFQRQGLVTNDEDGFKLTRAGKYYADQIASDLFVV